MAVVYFVVVWVVGQLFELIEHTVKESLGPLVELFLTLSLQGHRWCLESMHLVVGCAAGVQVVAYHLTY